MQFRKERNVSELSFPKIQTPLFPRSSDRIPTNKIDFFCLMSVTSKEVLMDFVNLRMDGSGQEGDLNKSQDSALF